LESKEISNELGIPMPLAAKIIRRTVVKLVFHWRTEAIVRWISDR
jgi:hypothetical protein